MPSRRAGADAVDDDDGGSPAETEANGAFFVD